VKKKKKGKERRKNPFSFLLLPLSFPPRMTELALWTAINDDDDVSIRHLLQSHPTLNINWSHPSSKHDTCLHTACRNGDHDLIKTLLGHPSLDMNARNQYGSTPLMLACMSGKPEAVIAMLKDSRVNVEAVEKMGRTALWLAAYYGHCMIVEWMLASGREVKLEAAGREGGEEVTPLQVARKGGKTEVVRLLEKFEGNQERTRREIRTARKAHGKAKTKIAYDKEQRKCCKEGMNLPKGKKDCS